jgi:hypothetical protein
MELAPVVFIHFGPAPAYLLKAIGEAAAFGNKVYLLSDTNCVLNNSEWIDTNGVNQDETEFKAYYKHMSSNTYQFEFMCIYRWFILKNFMLKHQIKKVLYLDSDVYLYENTSKILGNYPEFEFAYNLPQNQDNYYWAGSACCSLWTQKGIQGFCDLIKQHYVTDKISKLNEKWNYHTTNKVLGGICDMTFLYLYSSEPGFLNLGKVFNSCSFDFNNAISANYLQNEYAFKQGNLFQIPTKEIIFNDGRPNCKNLVSGETVRFFALTEYAKLLEHSKKATFMSELKLKLYRIKKRILE